MTSIVWLPRLLVACSLGILQIFLTPYLAYEGRGIRSLLPDQEAQILLCVLVFAAALAASFLMQRKEIWPCCFRSALWSAVLTLLFFEVFCCGVLRFDAIPPSGELHWNAAWMFFVATWALSFHVLRIDGRFLRRLF